MAPWPHNIWSPLPFWFVCYCSHLTRATAAQVLCLSAQADHTPGMIALVLSRAWDARTPAPTTTWLLHSSISCSKRSLLTLQVKPNGTPAAFRFIALNTHLLVSSTRMWAMWNQDVCFALDEVSGSRTVPGTREALSKYLFNDCVKGSLKWQTVPALPAQTPR